MLRSQASDRAHEAIGGPASVAGPAVVSAVALTRAFGDKLAVDGLTLDIERGEVFALLGHNGAGKTTTLRLLAGVLTPTSGEARLFGLSSLEHGPRVRARLGVLPENAGLEERLTARQNLRYYAELYGYPEERVAGRGDEMLGLFGLSEAADTRVGGFSKGMRQRLALARALQHEPELLFLDEPTSGLDPVATRQVIETIQRQSRVGGRTVVICTHDLALAQRICDRVAVMRQGRLVALGTPRELTGIAPHGKLLIGVGSGQRQTAVKVLLEAFPQAEVEGEARGEMTAKVKTKVKDGVEGGAEDGVEDAVEDRVEDRVAGGAEPRDEILASRLPPDATPSLVARLVAAGVAVMRVEPVQPTLADVYFALYGNAPNGQALNGDER